MCTGLPGVEFGGAEGAELGVALVRRFSLYHELSAWDRSVVLVVLLCGTAVLYCGHSRVAGTVVSCTTTTSGTTATTALVRESMQDLYVKHVLQYELDLVAT